MTDTTTAPPPASTARRTPARPQLSVRPVAVGGLNAATIAGATIAAAGGGLALAATAAGAAGVAAVAGARSKNKAAATRAANRGDGGGGLFGARGRSRTAGGSTAQPGGLPRAGRSSAGTPGRAPGSKPSPFPRGSSTRGGGSGRGSSGSGAGAKSGGNGRGTGSGLFGRSRGSSGTGTNSGHRKTGSTPGSGKRAPLTADRVSAARRKLANRRMPGPRLSDAVRSATATNPATGKRLTARAAFAAARRSVTGSNPKRRGPLRRAAAGVLAGSIAAAKVARAQRARKRKAAAARAAKNVRIQARKNAQVATAVRKPDSTPVSRTVKPAPAPAPKHTTSPPVKTDSEGTITMAHPMLDLSEDYLKAAIRNQPEGMLQVTADAHVLPMILDNLVKAMRIGFDRAMDQPLHPAIKDMYQEVHKAQVAVRKAAEVIGPEIERVHESELYRLRNPRQNEEMWDRTRNRGAA